MAKHVMLNGDIIPSAKPCVSYDNRGLVYGDSFSFELRGNSSRAFLFDEYFNYMLYCISCYGMDKPALLKSSIFAKDLELLLQKNRIYKGFSALITVFRNGSVPKLAEDNSISILISVEALPDEYYVLNEKGIKVDILRNYKISDYVFNNNWGNVFSKELLFRKNMEENRVDDLLLLNERGCIVKATDSNAFFVKSGKIIIPERFENNYQRIFSKYVENLAVRAGIPIIAFEVREPDLMDMEEIFLVNPIFGIKWILIFRDKRYFNKISALLVKEMNKDLMKS